MESYNLTDNTSKYLLQLSNPDDHLNNLAQCENFQLGIYEELLKDKVITLSFKEAIEQNSEIFKDKDVLEIGSSLCLFPSFAIKAGARHVYSLTENKTLTALSHEILTKNNLKEKISIIPIENKIDIVGINLPVEKVDIIIANWMGVLLLKDSLLSLVIRARDRWLNNDGFILPDKAAIYIASFKSDTGRFKEKINFWNNVHGIDMSVIGQEMRNDVLNEKCEKDLINSSICKIYEVDMYKALEEDLTFSSKYEISFDKTERIQGIVGWFDVFFSKIPNKIFFTTSPFNRKTSYNQCIFFLDSEEIVLKGEKLNGSFALRENLSVDNIHPTGVKISFHFCGKITNKRMIKYFKFK